MLKVYLPLYNIFLDNILFNYNLFIIQYISLMDKQDDHEIIYFAAALFNTKECHFNAELCHRLEQAGYKVKLPQRDGFEMTKF